MKKNEYNNRANIIRLNGLRMSPRKVRILINLIRDQGIDEALTILEFSGRAAAKPLAKALEAAVANVRVNLTDWNPEDLYIAKAWVDAGPTMRRFRPRAQGRATRINKRTSKVTIELRPDSEI